RAAPATSAARAALERAPVLARAHGVLVRALLAAGDAAAADEARPGWLAASHPELVDPSRPSGERARACMELARRREVDRLDDALLSEVYLLRARLLEA